MTSGISGLPGGITVARRLLEHFPAAVAMFDRDMRYLAYSKRWLTDYGIETTDVLGRSHYELFPQLSEGWRDIHRRAIAGETIACEEEPFPRRDGTLDWVKWEMLPWRDEGGEIGGALLLSQVITGSRWQRVHAARASAMGAMAATLAHELNQPVTAIKAYVEGVRALASGNDQTVDDALEHASAEATRAGEIVRKMRRFIARPPLERRTHSLAETVHSAIVLAAVELGVPQLDVTVAIDAGCEQISADRIQIEQVLIDVLCQMFRSFAGIGRAAAAIVCADADPFVKIAVKPAGDAMSILQDDAEAGGTHFSDWIDFGFSLCRTIVETNGGRIRIERIGQAGFAVDFTVPKAR